MTKAEVAKMFKYLLNVYPDFQFEESTIEVWQSLIYFIRKEEAFKCLEDHIRESSYPPKVADIYMRWQGNMHPKSTHKRGD